MKGGKRHIVTDTLGLLLWCVVHAAYIQDCDRARITINEVLERFPSLKRVFADGGYRGDLLSAFIEGRDRSIEIVRRPDDAKGFVPQNHRVLCINQYIIRVQSRNQCPHFTLVQAPPNSRRQQ